MGAAQELLFWGDSDLGRLERSNYDGSSRLVLLDEGVGRPVALAPMGDFLYWADAGSEAVLRTDMLTGGKAEKIKTHVKHLSGLISVSSHPDYASSPCHDSSCSHLCLVSTGGAAFCSCPLDSGLVLNADGETCGLPPTCKPTEFACGGVGSHCIPLKWRCDGDKECADFSDEVGCPDCHGDPGKFLCKNGDCVNATLLCDGKDDCADHSDEASCCRSQENEFRCAKSNECIEHSRVCDGVVDCKDSSDEFSVSCSLVGGGATPLNSPPLNHESSTSSAIIVIVVIIAFVLLLVVAFIVCKLRLSKRTRAAPPIVPPTLPPPLTSDSRSNPDGVNLAATTMEHHHHMLQLQPRPLDLPTASSSNNMAVSSTGAVHPATGEEEEHEEEVGSSNGVMYDRNRLTGASSSPSSSCFQQQQQHAHNPSPTTTMMNPAGIFNRVSNSEAAAVSTMPHRRHHHQQRHNHHYRHLQHQHQPRGGRRGHQSMQYLHQQHYDPQTPYSTDVNEESDIYQQHLGGLGSDVEAPRPPQARHFTSEANSMYGDSDAGGGHYQETYPLNQRRHHGQEEEEEEENSAACNSANEGSPFFVNSASVLPGPPPPRRAPDPP